MEQDAICIYIYIFVSMLKESRHWNLVRVLFSKINIELTRPLCRDKVLIIGAGLFMRAVLYHRTHDPTFALFTVINLS